MRKTLSGGFWTVSALRCFALSGLIKRGPHRLSGNVDMNQMDATATNTSNEQQRKQLQDRLGLDQHLLQCVLHQLPLHPRQWNMVTATCSELRDAVDGGRKRLRREIRNEHEETVWRDQWAGELLVKLAQDVKTTEGIRVMVAGAPVDCRGKVNFTALIWAARRADVELMEASLR